MDEEQEREHSAQADRHIAAAKRALELQKKIIEKLAYGGRETNVATSLLHTSSLQTHAASRRPVYLTPRSMPSTFLSP